MKYFKSVSLIDSEYIFNVCKLSINLKLVIVKRLFVSDSSKNLSREFTAIFFAFVKYVIQSSLKSSSSIFNSSIYFKYLAWVVTHALISSINSSCLNLNLCNNFELKVL